MVVEIHHTQDLKELLDRSNSGPILIFKHSTQCSVSALAYDEFMGFMEQASEITAGLVLVIEDRDVSDEIESQLKVRHASPQAIVVRNGRSAWVASHWSITTQSLIDAVQIVV
jgi:bacillithiol system protein YtxJ